MNDSTDLEEPSGSGSWRGPMRLITGFLLIAALLWVFFAASELEADSATFRAIVAIGIAIGVYLVTQGGD